MATLTRRPLDEAFLISEANGGRSRGVVTLKAGAVYMPGSVLIAELIQSEPGDPGAEPPVPASGYDTLTGKHVLATADAIADFGTTEAVILCRYTNATAGAEDAAVIARDAVVKDSELIVGAATTLADVEAAITKNGTVIRAAI
jgi:hypothetical protein